LRARVEALVERAQSTFPVRFMTLYGESQAGNYGLAVAWTGFMTMFPLIVGALAIIGLAIRDPATEVQIQTFVIQAFPPTAQEEIARALNGVEQAAGVLGIISIGGLYWGATSIFATLEFALTQIFGTHQRDLVRQRLWGLLMMLILIIAIVVIVALNSLVALLPFATFGPVVSFLVGAIVMTGLLVAIYRFLPNRTFRMRDVLPGAVLAGLGVGLLTWAFPLYARIAGHFNTYGAQFGLFFLLATWFYLLSQLLMLGAVLNKFLLDEAAPRKSPVDEVEENQGQLEPPPPPRRSVFQRVALAGVVAVAMVAGAVRRRRSRTTA
jgi:membrane protein